jgi:hypothetical protein
VKLKEYSHGDKVSWKNEMRGLRVGKDISALEKQWQGKIPLDASWAVVYSCAWEKARTMCMCLNT